MSSRRPSVSLNKFQQTQQLSYNPPHGVLAVVSVTSDFWLLSSITTRSRHSHKPKGMSSSTEIKKKHVRFASMEDNDDDEQEEDTLFDKRRDVKGLKSALKTSKGAAKCRCEQRVEVVGGSRGGQGACGRWMVTFTLCASFLSLVRPLVQKKYRAKEKTNKQTVVRCHVTCSQPLYGPTRK